MYAVWQTSRGKRAAARRRIASWGRAQIREGDFSQIARYHRVLAESIPEVAAASLGDQEWRDLGMDDLFRQMDRTCGATGQQVLYHRMRSPARSPVQFGVLGDFESSVRRFSDDVATRERAQTILLRLDDSAVYALPRLFLGPLPSTPRFARLFLPLAIAPLVVFAAALAGLPHGWAALLVILCINYVMRSVVAADVAWIAQPVKALNALLGTAAALAEERDVLSGVGAALARLRRLRRITFLTSIADGAGDDIIRAVVDYFNLIFLIDINIYVAALDECARCRTDIHSVFQSVGDVDAALAVASFRAGRPDWCRPAILPAGSGIVADNLAHPLVANVTVNDVAIANGCGIVITGSNMSGKTTLLRAIGVNVVLAQTIHTCIATRFACPPLSVRTAIALSDNLLAGQSYYLAEATNALRMVLADEPVQQLFLLDELFRGTNTTERIAAGVAVMEALLDRANMAIVAMHDLEVVKLVSATYQPRHFAESVTKDGFSFDYVLRAGPATQRNAVALLGVLGAPSSLIARATEICAELEDESLASSSAAPDL